MIVLAYVIAILLPLGFLYLIYAQDLYGQGKFGYVLLAFGWGLAAFGAAYAVNTFVVYDWLLKSQLKLGSIEAFALLPVLYAPIVEEVLKSLVLIAFLGRQMTYFVDGAIYGFAGGIGFSVLENILYLSRESSGSAILVSILRVLSTCLMHGAAAALVGTAIGRLRYGRGVGRVLSAVLGWALAIGLHMGFNQMASLAAKNNSVLLMLAGMGIGIGGAVLIVVFIRWGLEEEKRWIGETLGIAVSATRQKVTKQEVAVVRKYEQIDELLRPIVEHFGQEKADLVEQFLLKQARLGIKRKAQTMSPDPREQQKLGQEIQTLQEEMEKIRNQAGLHCMLYVRTIYPEDTLDLSGLVDQRAQELEEQGRTVGDAASIQAKVAARVQQGRRPAGGLDLWGRVGEDRDKGPEG